MLLNGRHPQWCRIAICSVSQFTLWGSGCLKDFATCLAQWVYFLTCFLRALKLPRVLLFCQQVLIWVLLSELPFVLVWSLLLSRKQLLLLLHCARHLALRFIRSKYWTLVELLLQLVVIWLLVNAMLVSFHRTAYAQGLLNAGEVRKELWFLSVFYGAVVIVSRVWRLYIFLLGICLVVVDLSPFLLHRTINVVSGIGLAASNEVREWILRT